MIDRRLRVTVGKPHILSNLIEVYLTFFDPINKKKFVATDIIYEEVKEGELPGINPCQIDLEAAQQLMDQLWDIGIRPTEGSGSAGQKAALEKHLGDFRKIVSKTLDIDLDN